jgi:hypothetical protein
MLNRRNWIKSAVMAAAGAEMHNSLRADVVCGPPVPPYGVQACIAGIRQEKMNDVEAFQEQRQWCWAACIEMVFTYWGHPIDQQEIVRRTWGRIVDMPAQPYQIISALNRTWTDNDGERFRSYGDVFTATGVTAARDLTNEMPLIVRSMGHAMVLTAISYNRAQTSQGQVTGAMVRDPWPGRGRRDLSGQEVMAAMLLARVRVA